MQHGRVKGRGVMLNAVANMWIDTLQSETQSVSVRRPQFDAPIMSAGKTNAVSACSLHWKVLKHEFDYCCLALWHIQTCELFNQGLTRLSAQLILI